MLKITPVNNINIYKAKPNMDNSVEITANKNLNCNKYKHVNSENLKAYIPSFCATKEINTKKQPSKSEQLKTIESLIDKEYAQILDKLDKIGILDNNKSNDGSSVLDNLYGIATEPRIRGLSEKLIIQEVIKAISNPTTITQKFGDIPQNVAKEIETETNQPLPKEALNVTSSSCTVSCIEYNLASKFPAEFARFARGLSSSDYCVDKTVKMTDISPLWSDALKKLKEFKTEHKILDDWNHVTVRIKPDRNAIVRARIQTSYKDADERSCVDVLIQSALLNLGSQDTYNALTDERTGELNPDKTGLTEYEKNFTEEIVLGSPKISVVYQRIDENGILQGYNCSLEETKQHILNSLKLGHFVIIGYTHLDSNNKVDGGHEITITGYKTDKNGNGEFICNDTDDDTSSLVIIKEDKLLPLIHHAGIVKEALNSNDTIVEPWREILNNLQNSIKE